MEISFKKSLILLFCLIAVVYVGTIFFFCSRIYKTFGYFDGGDKQSLIKRNYEKLIADHDAKKISFKTEDGLTLSGLLIKKPQAKCTVMICHGLRATKELLLPIVEFLQDSSCNIVLFDFRAHGQSEGQYISLGALEQKDVQAAVSYIKNNAALKNIPLFALGISMGAATLLCYQAIHPTFDGLIIDSTYTDLEKELKDRVDYHYPWLPSHFVSLAFRCWEHIIGVSPKQVKPLECIKKISIPILFMHAKADTIVPYKDTILLYAAHKGKKSLWISLAKKHAELYLEKPQEYARRIKQFFKL